LPIGIGGLTVGLLIALLAACVASLFWTHRDTVPDQGIGERIQPIAHLEQAPPPDAVAEKGKRTGIFLVHESCRSCHSNAQLGAPMIGDRRAWAPRIDQGLEALVQSAISGKCGIAPGGIDADRMELARAVVYMIWPRMRL
jgi:cytochrome c5